MGLAMVLWVCLLGWEALACWEREHLPLEMGLAIFEHSFFFFWIWWCIINKYEWSFDLLLHIFEGWKMAFGFGRIFIDESFCCLYFFGCTSL